MVLEVHGVRHAVIGRGGPSDIEPLFVAQAKGSVKIGFKSWVLDLTPEEARHLARCLNRLAKRVEENP